jgi:hypothetical protein
MNIFISHHNVARVFPSPQELGKLLTQGGNQHHSGNMNDKHMDG